MTMWKKTLVVLSTFLFLFPLTVGNAEALTWEEIMGKNILEKLLNEVVNLINRVNSAIEYIKDIPSQVVDAISGTFGLIYTRISQIYTYVTGLPSVIVEKIILLPGHVIGVFTGLFEHMEALIYRTSDVIENRIPSSMVAFALPVAVALFLGTWVLIIALIQKIMNNIPFV